MDWRALLAIASLLVGGCSVLRDPGDFTFADGGTDERCADATECPARPRATATCEDATCVYACGDGFDDCDGDPANGCETDTRSDVEACGACAEACSFANAIGACTDSRCELMACRTGFEDCDGDPSNGCEANLQSTATCGGCDVACRDGELCDSTGASPVCSVDCDGTVCGDECVDTTTNPQRCGGCDTECPVPAGAAEATCADAACGFTCLTGRDDCDGAVAGCETNTTNDLANCGGCGQVCDDTGVLTQSCEASACAIAMCETGAADCNTDAADGCETDLATDAEHCGACGNACAAGTVCTLGVCDPVRQVARGEGQGCLVRESGRVACWGENGQGQAGVGTPRAVEAPQTMVVSSAAGAAAFRARFVAAGNSFTCAIDLAGELYCWGMGVRLGAGAGATNTPFPQPVVADGAAASFDPRTFTRLDANEGHACAVDDLGGVWCWGLQQNGCVPGSGDAPGARPVVGLPTAAVDVAVNNGASCAALDDGSVWCWGSGTDGQLGDGALAHSATPVRVSVLSGATQVDGMWRTFCAIEAGGRLSCWGNNTSGQIGPRRTGNREATPVEVASGVTDVWQSLFSVCWQDAAGVGCRGRNIESQWGDGRTEPYTTGADAVRIPGLDAFTGFDAGRRGGCAILDGRGHCWGASYEGSVPRASMQLETPTPVASLGGGAETGYTALSVGPTIGCAIRTGIARCWGNNGSGGLGDGTAITEARPVDVADLTTVVDVSVGSDHACAIDESGASGQAWCWGSNSSLQLGSSGGSAVRPRLVDLAGAERAVEAGSFHTCAITDGGAVACWGANFEGQAGQPASASASPALTVSSFTDATALALGHRHSCVLRAGGTVECWGANDSFQLGDGTTTPRHTAAPVPGLANVTAIAAGSAHTCALQSTGQIRCWGAASRGQLGDGTGSSSGGVALVDYTAMQAVAIGAGSSHTCAAYVDGSVRCWGANDYFQSGQAATSDLLSPALVSGITDATAVSAGADGAFLSCALRGGASPPGSIRCWGLARFGAGGDGVSLYYPPTPLVLP